jgi:hypothetical protein
MMLTRSLALRFILGAFAPLVAFAQNPVTRASSPDSAAAPVVAVRVMKAVRAPGSIQIDGKLDEAAWAAAVPSGDFTQSYPKIGAVPTDPTEIRVLYDDAALYIGARMFDARPDSIAAQMARRDASGIYSDWLHVVIDSYHDRRNAFRFSVNPRGVPKDVLHSDDRNEDINWDAVWEVATSVDSLGWVAEYRIPFSQLRFSGAAKGAERIWGIQVQRDIARRNQRDSWSPWKQTDPGYVSFSGDLVGIVDIPTPRRLEVMPYVSTKVTREPGDRANPFFHATEAKPSAGADLRYGLPGGLTLTATANPDFGQVEVDPAVVNLSAFESFFPEKRPFFVEGASIFSLGTIRGGPSFGSQQVFYSRRIGRPPQRFPNAQYIDRPDATTILGAAKVTGRVGKWTVGVLDALTAEESARTVDASNLRSTTPVEPMTNYFVGRVRRDFRGSNTILGFGGTAVNRDLSDSVFTNLLRSRAIVASGDFEHRWRNREYTLTGAFSRSLIGGSVPVMINAQRSSARYYQRPDADYLEVDPNATSLYGYSSALGFNKSGTWGVSATAKQVSPGFEVNDLGFMGRVDYRNFGANVNYNNQTPGKLLRSYTLGAGTNHAWNYGGNKIWTSMFTSSSLNFTNLWSAYFGGEYDPGEIDDRLTRGGPLGRQPTQYGTYLEIDSDTRKPLSYFIYSDYYGDVADGYSTTLQVGLTVRPSSSIRVTVTPSLSRYRNTIQSVGGVTDALATSTFGRRYLFSDLHQTTVSATTRVEWTLSPALSFQLYAQPFASSGEYGGFKQLAAPATENYLVFGRDSGSTITPVVDPTTQNIVSYSVDPDGAGAATAFSIDNPDFRTHSLRGNAVVRWEYRPGSALFFVWQQERSDYLPFEGNFRPGREARQIFGRPSNVFLVKATYWFAR